MNIFLPYENNIKKSVESLDDLRLKKQILEVKQILRVALKESTGYAKHPITEHYIKYPPFLILYGVACCEEYKIRFGNIHKDSAYFTGLYNKSNLKDCVGAELYYIPFYAEGSKDDPNNVRTTADVSFLYQKKLINKWNNDKRPPKWTNREKPEFYKEKKC